jgi:hypothetical protein
MTDPPEAQWRRSAALIGGLGYYAAGKLQTHRKSAYSARSISPLAAGDRGRSEADARAQLRFAD